MTKLFLVLAILTSACVSGTPTYTQPDSGTCYTVYVDRCAPAPTVLYEIEHYDSCIEPEDGGCLAECLQC
jgi:hypothetical protein